MRDFYIKIDSESEYRDVKKEALKLGYVLRKFIILSEFIGLEKYVKFCGINFFADYFNFEKSISVFSWGSERHQTIELMKKNINAPNIGRSDINNKLNDIETRLNNLGKHCKTMLETITSNSKKDAKRIDKKLRDRIQKLESIVDMHVNNGHEYEPKIAEQLDKSIDNNPLIFDVVGIFIENEKEYNDLMFIMENDKKWKWVSGDKPTAFTYTNHTLTRSRLVIPFKDNFSWGTESYSKNYKHLISLSALKSILKS